MTRRLSIVEQNAVNFLARHGSLCPGEDPGSEPHQIIKAVLLLCGASFMAFMVLWNFGFSPEAMFAKAVEIKSLLAADALTAEAVKAGARITQPVAEMFWGDRYGRLIDPYGHQWSVATRVRDVSAEEIEASAARIWP